MKKINEMKMAKSAILSEMEKSNIGGWVKVGPGTNYYGPSNPSHITTYVDGMYWGEDGLSGSLFGDYWSVNGFMASAPAGLFKISSSAGQ